jgi:hypothetical protein
MMEISLLDLDDVVKGFIDLNLELLNQGLAEFEHQEGRLHMLPSDIEVDGFDGHAFMELRHDGALVVIGATEDVSEKLHHGTMQLRDVRNVLQEEVVDAVVIEYELIELRHDLLQLVMTTQLFKQRHL